MSRQKKEAALQCACGTDILAEGRLTHAHVVGDGDGQDQDKDHKDDIFEIHKSFFQMQFRRGNLVDQFLQQTERAKPAADRSAKECAESKEQARYIEAEGKLSGTVHCLQGADGTGKAGSRTGIAV